MSEKMLESIKSPADLRGLSFDQLDQLSSEIRAFLIEKVSKSGGHLGPNLGVVELTIAMHRVFDSPKDVMVFDTGHQSYVHKLLTGRMNGFDKLRQRGGLAGYPNRSESDHDVVENSHASTALSWSDGIAKGFAVDMAVRVLISEGITSGSVNAGGDLRVFGKTALPIQIRDPELPENLLEIGSLKDGAIATSSLYFAKRDQQMSHIINPLAQNSSEVHAEILGSFSVLAKECVYADALTKVLALSNNENHPCFARFSAQALRIAA